MTICCFSTKADEKYSVNEANKRMVTLSHSVYVAVSLFNTNAATQSTRTYYVPSNN